MVQVLKIKELLYRLFGRFEVYVLAAVRFVIAFTAFSMINSYTGYMKALSGFPIALVFALICSFLPAGLMMFLAAVLILLQFYALSQALCLVTAMIFVVLFCVYLRFSSRQGLYAVLTPICAVLGIPYAMPVAVGLYSGPYTVLSVLCGEITYFILKHVNASSALFSSTNESSTSSILTMAATEILTDKEMYLYLAAFVIAAVVVYCVRKFPVTQAHLASVLVGIVIQVVVIGGGEIYLGNSSSVPRIVIGCVISLLLMLVVCFMTHSLDYTRVEHVQFEDDEYYYYVKAVPKAMVVPEDKQVKQIHVKKTKTKKPSKSKKAKTDEVGGEQASYTPEKEMDMEQELDALEAQIINGLGDVE